MEWIIFLTVILAIYFVYLALQRQNDIQQKDLEIKQKQVELKERELELKPEYRYQRQKETWDDTIATGEKFVLEDKAARDSALAEISKNAL